MAARKKADQVGEDEVTGGEGRKRDRAETERKLREAAVQVFSEHGFDGATTKLVAQTAGINEALINRYFNGKNGLLFAILAEYMKEEQARTLNYPPCDTLEEEIREFCQAKSCDFRIKERGHMMRIVVSRVAVDEEVRTYVTKSLPVKKGDPRLVERLERLKSLGKIPRGIDSEIVADTVGGQVFVSMVFGHLIFGFELDHVTKQLKHFAETYTRGLLVSS